MPGSVQVQRQNCLHLHNMEGSDSCSVTIPLVNTAIRMYGVFDMTLISCVHVHRRSCVASSAASEVK